MKMVARGADPREILGPDGNEPERQTSNKSFDQDVEDEAGQEMNDLKRGDGAEKDDKEGKNDADSDDEDEEAKNQEKVLHQEGKTKFDEEEPAQFTSTHKQSTSTQNMGPVMKGRDKDVVDDDDDVRRKRFKKFCAFGFCICCLLILLIILLIIFYRVENEGLARAQALEVTDAPTGEPTIFTTDAPTNTITAAPTDVELTDTPTSEPTTPEPTATEPTPFPTAATSEPTAPVISNIQVSRLPCNEIYAESQGGNHGGGNFPSYYVDGDWICSDTYGPDDDHPNRNPWAVAYGRRDCPEYNYEDGFDTCDTVGARWCSLAELQTEIGQGTGCGGDRMFVWTYDDCVDSDGNSGKYMFDYGLRDSRESSWACETDMETVTSVARCCGDFYDSD